MRNRRKMFQVRLYCPGLGAGQDQGQGWDYGLSVLPYPNPTRIRFLPCKNMQHGNS